MNPRREAYLRSILPEGARLENMLQPRDREELQSDYKRVIKIANDFLTGRVGLLGASRAFCIMSVHVDVEAEEEFNLFTEIAEDSRDLPIGSDREFYAYNGSDEDLKLASEKLEAQYGAAARAAAQSLMKKFRVVSEQADPPNGGPANHLENSGADGGPLSVI
jgi:hypothetical protein